MQAPSSDEEMFFVNGVNIDIGNPCFLHRNDIFTTVHINGKPIELPSNVMSCPPTETKQKTQKTKLVAYGGEETAGTAILRPTMQERNTRCNSL